MSKKVLFYVQHLLGMGHVYRAIRLCNGLHDSGMNVTMVTGGEPVPVLKTVPYDVVQLPAIRSADAAFSGLVTADGWPVDDAYKAKRREELLDLTRELSPHAVVVEAFPFARRQMRFELLPLLEHVRTQPDTIAVASVRDILQENRKPGRDEETANWLNNLFDAVFVHGDKRIASLGDTFPQTANLTTPVFYTGLVAPQAPEPAGKDDEILVTVGGGAVGEALLEAACAAARHERLSDHRWVLSTGPNLPDEAQRRLTNLAPNNVRLVPYIENLPARMHGSALSVSQAGYNTVADILAAGCRAVLVPFATGGETEQTRRAAALQRMGRCAHLTEDDLDGTTLAAAVITALEQDIVSVVIDLNGAGNSAQLLTELFKERGKA